MRIARFSLYLLAYLNILFPLASALWQRDPLSVPREALKSASAGNLIAFAGGAAPFTSTPNAAIDFYDASHAGLNQPRLSMTMPFPFLRHFAVGTASTGTPLFFHIGTGTSGSGATNQSVQYVFMNESDTQPLVTPYFFPAAGRYDVGAAGTDGVIIWAGGFSGTHEVDMFIWRMPTNPTDPVVISPYPSCTLTQSASEVVGAAFGRWIVFSGGINSGSVRDQVLIIETSSLASACQARTMITDRYQHVMGITAKWIVIMGGTATPGGTPLSDWETIDPVTGIAGPSSTLTEGKKQAAGACNDRGCIIIGGETAGTVKSSNVEFIDLTITGLGGDSTFLTSNAQFPTNEAPAGVTQNAAACALNGAIIVAGGRNDTAAQTGVYVYGAFYSRPLPPRLSVSRASLAAASFGDVALFAGGQRPIGAGLSPVGAIDMFFYSNGSMQPAPFSLQPHRSHLCACVANGVIVFAGGNNGTTATPSASDSIEYYHVASNTWGVASERLTLPRSNLGCVTLGNKILVGSGLSADLQSIIDRIDVLDVTAASPYVSISGTIVGSSTANYGAAVRTYNSVDTACFYQGEIRPSGATLRFYVANDTSLLPVDYSAPGAEARSNLAAVAVRDDDGEWRTFAAGGLVTAPSPGANLAVSFIQIQGQGTELGISSLPYNVSNPSGAGMPNRRRIIFAGGKQSGAPQSVPYIDYYDVGLRITVRTTVGWSGAAVGDDNTGIFVVAGGFEDNRLVTDTVGVFYTENVVNSFIPPPIPVPCSGTPPAASAACINGVWVLTGVIVVPAINITTGEVIVIEGQIQLPPGAVTVIYSGNSSAPIVVTGIVQIDGGPLYITLSGSPVPVQVIPIITGSGSVTGGFTTVVVTGGDTECTRVTGELQQTGGIGVILSIEDTCQNSELSKAAIAGIAVGGAFGLALVLLLLLLLLKRARAGSGLFQAKDDELTVTV